MHTSNKKQSQGRLIGALVSILSIAFAIILFMNPFMRSTTVLRIVGIYMILYGLTVLFDFFSEIFKWNLNDVTPQEEFVFLLPLFITAFIPSRLMSNFNNISENISKSKYDSRINAPEGKERVDLEVFIQFMRREFK